MKYNTDSVTARNSSRSRVRGKGAERTIEVRGQTRLGDEIPNKLTNTEVRSIFFSVSQLGTIIYLLKMSIHFNLCLISLAS